MFSLHYHELLRKTKEKEEKKCLMDDNYMLDKLLPEIKEIIAKLKFGYTKILIDTDHKLPNYITLKNAVILTKCFIKDDDKFDPQCFIEETLHNE